MQFNEVATVGDHIVFACDSTLEQPRVFRVLHPNVNGKVEVILPEFRDDITLRGIEDCKNSVKHLNDVARGSFLDDDIRLYGTPVRSLGSHPWQPTIRENPTTASDGYHQADMDALDMVNFGIPNRVWLASRDQRSEKTMYGGDITAYGVNYWQRSECLAYLCRTYSVRQYDDKVESYSHTFSLMPVIALNDLVVQSGNGTAESPYVLGLPS